MLLIVSVLIMGASTSASEALSSSSFTSTNGKTKAAFTKHNGFGHFQPQANGGNLKSTTGRNGSNSNGPAKTNGLTNGNNGQSKSNGAAATGGGPRNNGKFESDHIVPADFIADTKLPTDVGQFQLRAYRVRHGDEDENEPYQNTNALEPVVIYSPDKPPFGKNGKLAENVPVRIHDQCLTSEVFRSRRYVISRAWGWSRGCCRYLHMFVCLARFAAFC